MPALLGLLLSLVFCVTWMYLKWLLIFALGYLAYDYARSKR